MKQQQTAADFFSSKATYSCRYCNAEKENRDDLLKNTIRHDKYHHQIAALRYQSEKILLKIKRAVFYKQNDLRSKASALTKLISALNFIIDCFFDSVHNEYFELIRKLYFIIYSKIFTIQTKAQFFNVFRQFFFSSEWARI